MPQIMIQHLSIRQILHTTLHHTSYIIHHTSYIIHHTSYIIHHTSYIIHHTSYIIHHTSYIIHHTSYIIHHTSYIIHHTSLIIHHTSYIIHHTFFSFGLMCDVMYLPVCVFVCLCVCDACLWSAVALDLAAAALVCCLFWYFC